MIYNISGFNTIKSINWELIISSYCNNWRNYSTNAHDTYIVIIGLIFIFSLISYFYNPRFKYFKKIEIDKTIPLFFINIIKFFKLDIVEFDFKLFYFLRNICINILIIRIFQIYMIIHFYLGG